MCSLAFELVHEIFGGLFVVLQRELFVSVKVLFGVKFEERQGEFGM